MTANPNLLQKKYSRVIAAFAKRVGLSLDEALAFFYHSITYRLVSEGISDMHCMSDDYLAEELEAEYFQTSAEVLPLCESLPPKAGKLIRNLKTPGEFLPAFVSGKILTITI